MSADSSKSDFPWQRIMELGLGYLRLSPVRFWAMTPKELHAATVGVSGGNECNYLTRSGITELINKYPDEVKNG